MRIQGRHRLSKCKDREPNPRIEERARVSDRYDFDPNNRGAKDSSRGMDIEIVSGSLTLAFRNKHLIPVQNIILFHAIFRKQSLNAFKKKTKKSGFSAYGEHVQPILMQELRSSRRDTASHQEKLSIYMRTLKSLLGIIQNQKN
jgi:hypothetical protein